MYGVIYKWENLINGKVYIGKSINVLSRYKKHLHYISSGTGFKIHDAIRKYGLENFKFEIIVSLLDVVNISDLEIELIKQHDSYANGYNMNPGGEGMRGFCHSEESKHKMRLSKLGKKLSDDHKEKIRIAGMGRIQSEESKKKLSFTRTGMKFSKEHVENMSKCRMGVSRPEHMWKNGVAATKTPEAIEKRRQTMLRNKLTKTKLNP